MPGPATSQPTPQRLAAIREQLSLLADYLDPQALKDRVEALERQMGEPGFWDDPEAAGRVGSEHARETRRLTTYEGLASDVEDLDGLVELAEEDPELAAEVEQAFGSVESRLEALEEERLFSGPYDSGDALVTVNAGAGGTDAQDWAEMVLRMLMRWAERRGFGVELLEASPGEEAGIKSATFRAKGENAYGLYAAEKGVHRLVRLSPFDAAHRRQTSFAGVEVAPVVEGTGEVEIDDEDLQIDTYRASGAGGQHVNKTDSAVRITHKPSGIVVQCQNERSQSSNKATAMAMLRSKLVELEERKRREEIAKERGEAQDVNFGSQIRSYVLHPYTMVKDHRTDEEMGDANRVLDGDLDGFVRAYLLQQAKGLAAAMVLSNDPYAPVTIGPGEVVPSDQPTAPYLDAVVAYGFRGSTRFHVPGHKAGAGADPGLRSAIGEDALMLDVPQDIYGIDLGPEPTPFQRAEQLAAEAHGAVRSWFLTNGASQGNHALCLALAPLGAPVVVQRNSHASVIDGLVLSGGNPSYVAPEYGEELGMAHGVTPEALAEALRATPGARAAWIVSPTYYGMAADVAGCAEVSQAAGVPLVVDQAWGSHFGFHPDLPPSALQQGADAVLTSTHKIVGSLTQSAMLHVAPTGRIDPDAVARAVRLVRSTSPSSLLMASLDAARRQLVIHGQALLSRTIAASNRARKIIDGTTACRVVGRELVGQPGVAGWDPLRIVVDVRATGCSGYEVAAALRSAYDVHVELATHATLVLVLGLGQPPDDLDRFTHDFATTVRRIERPGAAEALVRASGALVNEVVVPPREAFLGTSETVAVDDAVGRVSAESIAGYPPGIPALLPGERITAEAVAYLRELRESGARLHGASDPDFRTIVVLCDER